MQIQWVDVDADCQHWEARIGIDDPDRTPVVVSIDGVEVARATARRRVMLSGDLPPQRFAAYRFTFEIDGVVVEVRDVPRRPRLVVEEQPGAVVVGVQVECPVDGLTVEVGDRARTLRGPIQPGTLTVPRDQARFDWYDVVVRRDGVELISDPVLAKRCTECGSATVPRPPPEEANGADDDGDGWIDEDTELVDDDGDGFSERDGDCDDRNPWAHPGARWPDVVLSDLNCDGVTPAPPRSVEPVVVRLEPTLPSEDGVILLPSAGLERFTCDVPVDADARELWVRFDAVDSHTAFFAGAEVRAGGAWRIALYGPRRRAVVPRERARHVADDTAEGFAAVRRQQGWSGLGGAVTGLTLAVIAPWVSMRSTGRNGGVYWVHLVRRDDGRSEGTLSITVDPSHATSNPHSTRYTP